MLVYIQEQELPICSVSATDGKRCDVPDDILARWHHIAALFGTMQQEMDFFWRNGELVTQQLKPRKESMAEAIQSEILTELITGKP